MITWVEPGLNLLGLGVAIWAIFSAKKGVISQIESSRQAMVRQIHAEQELVVKQIKSDRDIAKKSNTMGLLLSSEFRKTHENAALTISKYSKKNPENSSNNNGKGYQSLAVLAGPVEKLSSEQVRDGGYIYEMLNFVEALAVGIRRNIYCEETAKDYLYTSVLQLHKSTLPFIVQIQTDDNKVTENSSTAYQEMLCLVNRWQQPENKLKKI